MYVRGNLRRVELTRNFFFLQIIAMAIFFFIIPPIHSPFESASLFLTHWYAIRRQDQKPRDARR